MGSFFRPRKSYAYYGSDLRLPVAFSRTISLTPFTRPAVLVLTTFFLSITYVLVTLRRPSAFSLAGSSPLAGSSRAPPPTQYIPFKLPPAAAAVANTTVRPIRAHTRLPDACIDEWVAEGRWREACVHLHGIVEDARIDLVYIWVNGSDPYHQTSRASLLNARNHTTRDARFRQHDELRYSFRSAFKNLPWKAGGSKWIVVAADLPAPGNGTEDEWLGLVPQWLDVDTAWAGGAGGEPPVYLYHDSQIFRMTTEPGTSPASVEEVESWRRSVLPTFNSIAIESQLPHLDPNVVSDNILYLNDDQFFLLPLAPSAFHTDLYGPVFRFVPGFMIDGDTKAGEVDGEGEWRSLGWSTLVLDRRFGTRQRAYVEHNARALSLPLMHEAALAFGKPFADTPRSQFRGIHAVPGEYEINTVFLATHYVVERQREALLWSWVVAKWGGAAGRLGGAEKAGMWRELVGGGDAEWWEKQREEIRRPTRARATGRDVALNMRAAGLEPPGSDTPNKHANAEYLFVSLDGFTPNYSGRLEEIVLQRDECLGGGEEVAWDVFRRLAFEKTHCGDAATASPSSSPNPPPTPPVPDPAILPLVLPTTPPPLPENPRGFAVRLIQRYAYTIGHVPSHFFGIESPDQVGWFFSWLAPDVAMLCVNDDLNDTNEVKGDLALRSKFREYWPVPVSYELDAQ
ncbi:hypothetical protein MKEN_00727000 [Mycena kentingensis (nom. inval.)]|nr:hypothetical protein MKEN_00727000 [Mycena kentingensis (nom. inval.)]